MGGQLAEMDGEGCGGEGFCMGPQHSPVTSIPPQEWKEHQQSLGPGWPFQLP